MAQSIRWINPILPSFHYPMGFPVDCAVDHIPGFGMQSVFRVDVQARYAFVALISNQPPVIAYKQSNDLQSIRNIKAVSVACTHSTASHVASMHSIASSWIMIRKQGTRSEKA